MSIEPVVFPTRRGDPGVAGLAEYIAMSGPGWCHGCRLLDRCDLAGKLHS